MAEYHTLAHIHTHSEPRTRLSSVNAFCLSRSPNHTNTEVLGQDAFCHHPHLSLRHLHAHSLYMKASEDTHMHAHKIKPQAWSAASLFCFLQKQKNKKESRWAVHLYILTTALLLLSAAVCSFAELHCPQWVNNNWLRVPAAEDQGTVAGSNKCWPQWRGNAA